MSAAPQIQPIANSPTALRAADAERVGIGHALIDACSFEQASSAVIAYALAGGRPVYVLTPNAQHVVLLETEMRLREVYQRASLIVPDGISLVLAARIFGRPLQERVAGVDLFQHLCALAAQHNLRVFLLGGRPGSAVLAAAELKKRNPTLHIDTYCPPMGFEQNAKEAEMTAEIVHAARPDLLFVGFGAPKQEYWIFDHGVKLGATVSVGVGGAFEMVAGIVNRAPLWIQHLGCEWLYRFYREPRRMWRRYLIGNLQFCGIVLGQRLRRAYLFALVSLLQKQTFAAELEELRLRKEAAMLASALAGSSSTAAGGPGAYGSI